MWTLIAGIVIGALIFLVVSLIFDLILIKKNPATGEKEKLETEEKWWLGASAATIVVIILGGVFGWFGKVKELYKKKYGNKK